jgi:hypothetical protein
MKNGKKSKADGRLRAKEAWFGAGTAAFERVFPGARARVYPELESPYICPLCGKPFPRAALADHAGRGVLERIPEISPEFLLKGVTGVARRDWAAALNA